MSDHDVEFGLVMPFVVCQSKGGPYDDEAYVAGYEMGKLDEALRVMRELGWTKHARTLHADNREQADLLAMHHGFDVKFSPVGEGWLEATFRPGEML